MINRDSFTAFRNKSYPSFQPLTAIIPFSSLLSHLHSEAKGGPVPGKNWARSAAPAATLHHIARSAETAHWRPLASNGTSGIGATREDRADFRNLLSALSIQLHPNGRFERSLVRSIATELFQGLRQQGSVRLNHHTGVAPFGPGCAAEEPRESLQREATNPTADSRLQSIHPISTANGSRESNAHERTNPTTDPHLQPIGTADPQVRRRPLVAVVETKPNCAPFQSEADLHQCQFSKRSQSRPMETKLHDPIHPTAGLPKSNAHERTNPTTNPHLQSIRTADPQARRRPLVASLQTKPIAAHRLQPSPIHHPRANKPNPPTPPRPPPLDTSLH